MSGGALAMAKHKSVNINNGVYVAAEAFICWSQISLWR
jgi:hypothetical protein